MQNIGKEEILELEQEISKLSELYNLRDKYLDTLITTISSKIIIIILMKNLRNF